MKLASVVVAGRAQYGAVTPRGFVDFSPAFADRCTDLRGWLAGDRDGDRWTEARGLLESAPATELPHVQFQPPVPNADARVFAVGWSYRDHQGETGAAAPEKPFVFTRLRSSLVGHGQPLVKPTVSDCFDFEGEIVIVIGKAGRHIVPAKAMAHVAGYAIGMDGSMRDWQKHSVTAGKNFDCSGAFGPWLVSVDEIPDPGSMELVTRVNDQVVQRATFHDMVWGVEGLVSYLSTVCHLEAGDAIFTGTPAGVGSRRNPPLFLKARDSVSVEVSGLGRLSNVVVDED